MDKPTDRLAATIAAVDAANAEDPTAVIDKGRSVPAELLYSQRMTERLNRHYPDASETLQIAARAQHIRRWTMPRGDFPLGRKGYNEWRTACRQAHAATAGRIMADQGYDQAAIDQVGKLIRKQELKSDPDSQRLQNVVGAVFVEHYLAAFADDHDDEKLIGILRKTARKLDEEGIAALAQIEVSPRVAKLLQSALA